MPDSLTPQSPALAALLARATVPAKQLLAPGPDESVIELAIAAALRAPDHAGAKPWRFICFAGQAREALGELLAQSLARRVPETPPERLELERAKPLRAPLVIAAGAAIRHGWKIPVWEQEASVSASVMNLLNAFDLQGFGAMWASSDALGDPAVKVALGLQPTDSLLGWIYVGTPPAERPRPVRPETATHWRWWQPA